MLEAALKYSFSSPELLSQALTHRSALHEADKIPGVSQSHNERLEFLGDAVLDLVLSAELMKRFPQMTEGDLSKVRASLVCEACLARVAQALGISQLIKLGKGERALGGAERPRILSSALEALFGALFQDGGYESVENSILSVFEQELSAVNPNEVMTSDFKSRLQEASQEKFLVLPSYKIIKEEGPDHARLFIAEVSVENQFRCEGTGTSKKLAEQAAAEAALKVVCP